jgi:hypothetical protein
VLRVHVPGTGGETKLSNPTQLPEQQALFEVQPTPSFEHVAPGWHCPETHRIVKVQSSLVRQRPPATVFATHIPEKHAKEQQDAFSLQGLPVGTQVEATGSTDGSPLMRQAATEATASVARRSFFMVGLRMG